MKVSTAMPHSWGQIVLPLAALFSLTLLLCPCALVNSASAEVVIINPALPYACSFSEPTSQSGIFGRLRGRLKRFSVMAAAEVRRALIAARTEKLSLSRRIGSLPSSALKRKLQRKLTLVKSKQSILKKRNKNCQRSVAPTPRPNCPQLSASISKPYAGKVVVGTSSDTAEGQSYAWLVNGALAASGTSPTTFLAHFDGDLAGVNGEAPVTQNGIYYEDALFGQGLVGKAQYQMDGNFGLEEGTIEIWMRLKQPLSSSVFAGSGGDPYIFRYAGPAGEAFMANIKSDTGVLVFTIYDGSGDWSNGAVQISSVYQEIPVDTPLLLSMTFSRSRNRSALFLNGFKIGQSHHELPVIPSGNFTIGNLNIVIDEFRILSEALPPSVIMDNYTRARPFEGNEIYLAQAEEGQELELRLGECWDSASVAAPKIGFAQNPGYILANTTALALDFTTPVEAICGYAGAPAPFSSLLNREITPTTAHHFVQEVSSTIPACPVYIKCQTAGQDGDDYAFYRRFRILPEIPDGFPRTANIFWGNPVADSEVAELARYDYLSLSKSNLRRPTVMRALREANPQLLLAFYIESNANPMQYGISSFEHEDLNNILSESWRLRNAVTGSYAYNIYYPGVVMYNINPQTPFAEKFVEHIEQDIVARGDFNSIFFDNTDSSFWQFYDYYSNPGSFIQQLDFDLDGVNEDLNVSADFNKARGIWIDGLAGIFNLTRTRIGEAVVINGNNGDANPQLYNGKTWERFFTVSDPARPPQNFFNAASNNSFLYWEQHARAPRLNLNLFENNYASGEASHYRYHRWGLAGSLLGGVYHASVTGASYRHLRWYDEYWVDLQSGQPTLERGSGRAYLGQPLAPPYEAQSGIWRRDFENGIALINLTSSSASVSLAGTLRFIQGSQDPAANPGGLTSSLTLAGYDGRVLIRALCSDNPSGDPRCIAQ